MFTFCFQSWIVIHSLFPFVVLDLNASYIFNQLSKTLPIYLFGMYWELIMMMLNSKIDESYLFYILHQLHTYLSILVKTLRERIIGQICILGTQPGT